MLPTVPEPQPRRRFIVRHARAIALVILAGVLGFLLAILWPTGGDAAPDPAPAPYNTGGALPGAELCLVDQTNGFPVEEAAREFDGIIEVTVTTDPDDCAGFEAVAHVRTVVLDESWSGWWNSPSAERDHGLIRLNLSQAFRIDGQDHWRSILIHEIAHAAGLEHTYSDTSIMHPLVGSHNHATLTDQDVAQLKELYR